MSTITLLCGTEHLETLKGAKPLWVENYRRQDKVETSIKTGIEEKPLGKVAFILQSR